jgi:dipeptidase
MGIKFLRLLACSFAALFIYQISSACSNIIITKGASKDGSIMVTYSADSHQLYGELYYRPAHTFSKGSLLDITEWDTGKYLGKIDQIAKTYQTVGNMNEHQLIITETTFGGREELFDPNAIMDYGSLIYITLQRAKTAREAIKQIDELVNKYGYASSGESFSIADKNEAWIFEIIGKGSKIVNGKNINKGAVWVAVRIPDGAISGHANQARITKLNFKDKENFLYSKDVVSFAREMGYFSGKDEDFSFCDVYAPLDFGALRGCEARVWSAFNILGKGTIGDKNANDYLDYAMGYNKENKMPLYFFPEEKVSLKEVADAMRDHYEGTPMDMTQDIGAGGHHTPYRWRPMGFEVEGQKYLNERAIATQQTGFWILCQSRSWLPDEIGGILWFGVDDAATSCLTPIYTSITEVPECIKEGNGNIIKYSPTSLFWVTNRITNFAYMLYDRIAPVVQKAANEFENSCITEISSIDKKAQESKNPRKVLTEYSVGKAQELFNKWQELDTYLLVKYIDGNVKVENEDGTFKDNGYSPAIPASPQQPGYNKKWKEAVVKDAGKTLISK